MRHDVEAMPLLEAMNEVSTAVKRMNPGTHYIPRNLSWIDKEQKKSIGEDGLLTEFQCPLVILGGPGWARHD